MGQVAEELAEATRKKTEPGCVVVHKLSEILKRDDLDDADKIAIWAAAENPNYPVRAFIEVTRKIGVKFGRDTLQQHRHHGDCAKAAK
jgi:hypothetical protein